MKIKNSLFLLIFFFALVSCNNKCEIHQKFRFRVDDSLARYDVLLYARLLPGFKGEELPFVLTILSPDGNRFRDTLSFSIASNDNYRPVAKAKSGVWRDYMWICRKNVAFPRRGLWVFSVSHLSVRNNLDNINNFELTLKRN